MGRYCWSKLHGTATDNELAINRRGHYTGARLLKAISTVLPVLNITKLEANLFFSERILQKTI